MTRHSMCAGVIVLLCWPSSAAAQAQGSGEATPSNHANPLERVYVGIGGGYQGGVKSFTDSITFTQYLEPARIDADYRRKNGPAVDATGTVRLWRNFAITVGFSTFSKAGAGEITADIPHPFSFRESRAGGPFTFGGVTHRERILRTEATFLIAAGNRTIFMFGAGPAFVSLTQQVVSSAQWRESGYPYDSPVVIDGVNTTDETGSKVGFAGGMDVGFYFSRSVGVGLGVRFVHAKVPVNDRVKVESGGLQAGLGLRLKLGPR